MSISLPNDVQSEAFLLSRMLSSINACNAAMDSLVELDFHDLKHQAIFSSMRIAYSQDIEIDHLSIAPILSKEFPDYADTAYVYGLKVHHMNDHEEVSSFIDAIKGTSQLRQLIYASQAVSKDASDQKKLPNQIYAEMIQSMEKVFSENFKTNKTPKQLLSCDYMDSGLAYLAYLEKKIEDYRSGNKNLRGFQTGYHKLDDKLSGLCPGHFIIIGARPGCGKTTFVCNLIRNLANQGRKIGFFSLEMTAEEALHKILCIESGVDSESASRGNINSDSFQEVVVAANRVSNYNLIIEEEPGLNLNQVISRTKRMVATHGTEILFIDYIGEIKGVGKFASKQEEIQTVSRGLRGLAKILKIPIVCICQLNRASETETRAPRKSDLRESGQIEADAHAIILMHKPSADNPNDKPGSTYLKIVKNRFGSEGDIEFSFEGNTGRFTEVKYG